MTVKGIYKDQRGFAMIEAAVIIPVLLAILFATIEFGRYFMLEYAAQRSVGAAASYLQTVSPNVSESDAKNINTKLPSIIDKAGFGMAGSGNACAIASASEPVIDCVKSGANRKYLAGRFDASVKANQSYWVRIATAVPYKTITGIEGIAGFKFPSLIVAQSDIQIAPATPTPPSASCTSSQYVSFDKDKNEFTCNFPEAKGNCKWVNASNLDNNTWPSPEPIGACRFTVPNVTNDFVWHGFVFRNGGNASGKGSGGTACGVFTKYGADDSSWKDINGAYSVMQEGTGKMMNGTDDTGFEYMVCD